MNIYKVSYFMFTKIPKLIFKIISLEREIVIINSCCSYIYVLINYVCIYFANHHAINILLLLSHWCQHDAGKKHFTLDELFCIIYRDNQRRNYYHVARWDKLRTLRSVG